MPAAFFQSGHFHDIMCGTLVSSEELLQPLFEYALVGEKVSAGCQTQHNRTAVQHGIASAATISLLAEAFRPTPVSRKRSTAVSPAGPQSEGSSKSAISPFNPQTNSSKVVNPRPCNRDRIDFHNCWACGRHSTGLWPSFVASSWLMPGACCALERGARRETCMALCASFASWRLTIQPTSNCTSSNVISSFKYIVG